MFKRLFASNATRNISSDEMHPNAQILVADGINAKEVMPTLSMLGDVAMCSKDRMQALSLAYSHISAKGKLHKDDLLQLINAGFNPLQQLSESTGQTMAKLNNDMSNGEIYFEDVRGAFIAATSEGGKFYKMTDKLNGFYL